MSACLTKRSRFTPSCAASADTRRSWGRGSLVSILRGDDDAPERGRESQAFGALAFRSEGAVGKLVDSMVRAGMFRAHTLDHGGVALELTPAGRDMADGKRPSLRTSKPSSPPPPKPTTEPLSRETTPAQERREQDMGPEDDLFERLRAWRTEIATAEGVPPFVVAHDTLFRRIVAVRPRNTAQLEAIKGMGEKMMERYGEAILALVNGAGPDIRDRDT